MQQEIDQRESDWKTFVNKSKEFDKVHHPKLKETLANEMLDLFIKHMKWIMADTEKYNFYNTSYEKIKEWLEKDYERLQNTTEDFVRRTFPGVKDISFHSKNIGNQLGTICHIHFEDGSVKKLYVKTHQFGPTASMSKSRKLADAKELFVYKLLENIGLGPKCYFFWPSNGSTKTILIGTEGIDLKFYTNETTTNSIQEKMELLKLDLISRILCISDSTTNSGNFGYCNAEKKGYIIDFGINERAQYFKQDVMEGFFNGNGEFNYTGVMSEAINIFTKEEKLLFVKRLLSEWNLEENVVVAQTFIANLISNSGIVTINSLPVLTRYVNGILETILTLRK